MYGIDETPDQRRRNAILGGVAVALAVLAVVAVVGFVWLRHDDNDFGAAADAVVDRLTAALNAHSDAGVRDVACAGGEDDFLRSVTAMGIDRARKIRDTQVSGDRATGLLTLTVIQPQAQPSTFDQSGYVQLAKRGDWCVVSIYNAIAN